MSLLAITSKFYTSLSFLKNKKIGFPKSTPEGYWVLIELPVLQKTEI